MIEPLIGSRPLPPHSSHPVPPSQSDAGAEDCDQERLRHAQPELKPGALKGNEQMPGGVGIGTVEVGEVICAEEPVSGMRGKQKSTERPLYRHKNEEEDRAGCRC